MQIEGTERTGSGGSSTEGRLTSARLELLEILPEQPDQDSQLLVFQHLPEKSDLQLDFAHTQRPVRRVHSAGASTVTQPRTRLS